MHLYCIFVSCKSSIITINTINGKLTCTILMLATMGIKNMKNNKLIN